MVVKPTKYLAILFPLWWFNSLKPWLSKTPGIQDKKLRPQRVSPAGSLSLWGCLEPNSISHPQHRQRVSYREKNVRFPEKNYSMGEKKTFIMGGNRGFFPTWKFFFCSFHRSVRVQLTTIWMAGEWSNLILWLVGQLLPNGSWLIMRDPRESQRQHQSHHLGLLQLWHK